MTSSTYWMLSKRLWCWAYEEKTEKMKVHNNNNTHFFRGYVCHWYNLSSLIFNLSSIKGRPHVSRHKSPDLYNNTRIADSDLTPEASKHGLRSNRQVFWLTARGERLPNNISDLQCSPHEMAAYSCGTVEDSHPIPLTWCACKGWFYVYALRFWV